MTGDRVRFEGVRREYDWEDTTATFAVIESISVFEYGTPNRTEKVLDAPLNDYINPDGLEKVVRSPIPVTLGFTISKYDIQISGNQVSVTSANTN